MSTMVFDVPAVSGGALTILREFYNDFKLDKNNSYILVVSEPVLEECENIKVLRFPWIKKSWLHRSYFDYFIAPRLVKTFQPDEILSLQNVIIKRTKVPQTVYVHNALPFSEYRFRLLKESKLWAYQNIIGRQIFKSIKKAEKVLVQTQWLRKKCIEILAVPEEKIIVSATKLNIHIEKPYAKPAKLITFFYPASGENFKNHKIILDACFKLKSAGIEQYEILFTLNGNENKAIKRIHDLAIEYHLPIKFIGKIKRELVFDYYAKLILLFPSYIETFGLPLLEARQHGTPIITSDCGFSHEVLSGYEKVDYFDPFDSNELVELFKKYLYLGKL